MILEVESFDLGVATGALVIVSKRWYHPNDLRLGPPAVDFFCRQVVELSKVDLAGVSTLLQGARRYLWNTFQTELHLYVALACNDSIFTNLPPNFRIGAIDPKGDLFRPEIKEEFQNLEFEKWNRLQLQADDVLWTLSSGELSAQKISTPSIRSGFFRASDVLMRPKESAKLFLSFPVSP